MKKKHNSLKSDLSCDTYKFGSKKKRLCLKCRAKFLSKRHSDRICEKRSLINERIGLKTHSVSSKPLVEENPHFLY